MLLIRIRKFLGLPDPSLLVRIRVLPLSSKKVRKTLISNVFRLLWDFWSLKADVNVPTKSTVLSKTKLENTYFLLAFWKPLTKRAGFGSVSQWYGFGDPDTKMSRIHNTASNSNLRKNFIIGKCLQLTVKPLSSAIDLKFDTFFRHCFPRDKSYRQSVKNKELLIFSTTTERVV